ncbi:MAG: TetR/AcrR family transcriptional regulator [Acidimicrobiales bacterium]
MDPPRERARGPRPREAKRTKRRRAEWGTLSRQQVVDVATQVVRGGGYDQMTIRSLAAELGVAPMSLYGHVRSKEDLLDEVVDRLLGEVWRPDVVEDEWQTWIAEAADRLRRFLVGQPAALHVYLRRPVVSASAIARMEAMMRVLKNAGLSHAMAKRAYGAIHTYTVGFAAVEASREHEIPTAEGASELARQLAAYTTPKQFASGLSYLLGGVLLESGIAEGQNLPSVGPR